MSFNFKGFILVVFVFLFGSSLIYKFYPERKYKNIIFDLGNVLFEWCPEKYAREIFKPEEHESLDLLIKQVSDFLVENDWRNLDCGLINESQFIKQLSHKYSNLKIEYLLKNVHQYLTPIKDGLLILEKIKKKKYNTYIISNFPKDVFDKIFLNNDFLKGFDGMIISSHVNLVKPDSKIYKTFLGKYNLDPSECLFIDDLKENIHGAKSCGIDGIICSDHKILFDELKRKRIL